MWITKSACSSILFLILALAPRFGMLTDAGWVFQPEVTDRQATTSSYQKTPARAEKPGGEKGKPIEKRLPDYSHPKKTARAFCAAIQTGDIGALKDCSIRPNTKTLPFRDATIRCVLAQYRFYDAARAKFGEDRLWNDNVAVWIKGTEGAKVRIIGNKASLRIKQDGTTFAFKKESEAWKLNLIELDEEEIKRVKPEELERVARDMIEDAKSYDRLAKWIKNGNLGTVDDLKREMGAALPPRAFFP